MSAERETTCADGDVTVPLADLALALYLPEPTVNHETRTCNACGKPCGAHFCVPRQAATERLRKIVTAALDV